MQPDCTSVDFEQLQDHILVVICLHQMAIEMCRKQRLQHAQHVLHMAARLAITCCGECYSAMRYHVP